MQLGCSSKESSDEADPVETEPKLLRASIDPSGCRPMLVFDGVVVGERFSDLRAYQPKNNACSGLEVCCESKLGPQVSEEEPWEESNRIVSSENSAHRQSP